MTDLLCIVIPNAIFETELTRTPEFANAFSRILAERMRTVYQSLISAAEPSQMSLDQPLRRRIGSLMSAPLVTCRIQDQISALAKQRTAHAVSSLVVLTETTGFYPYQGDEIISIAAVVVENGQIREDLIFNELVNPYRLIPPAIEELTGITAEMVADKRHICHVLNDFLDFIGDSVLVAHNAKFDLAFINIKLNWYTQTEIYNQVIDTYKLSRALSPELASHDLDTLLKTTTSLSKRAIQP